MKKYNLLEDTRAVSEVVGAVILVLIAVIVFATIVMYVFPLPIPPPEPNVKLCGYVNDNGITVIEHMGGESLKDYKIIVTELDGTLISTTTYNDKKDSWKIGECRYPNTGSLLLTENDKVRVSIYSTSKDGSEHHVFEGVLRGKRKVTLPPLLPMLISSLMTNTTDEDLICHTLGIEPQINPITYIYNWSVNGKTIANLIMPFDTNNLTTAKDYSGNNKNGNVVGPRWTNNGVVGGAYQFDGIDDYISLPYCFDEDKFIDAITVEAWIKTNNDSTAIASFNRSVFWDLSIKNGVTRWSTNANGHTTDTMGITRITDGEWHYVAATYDSSSGECIIYVDGELDKKENGHNPLEKLGTGSDSDGFIGKSIGGIISGSWNVLTYDDFESGWGNYTSGGRDCSRTNSYKHQGSYSANIQDNSGTESSFYLTNGIDVHTMGYTSIKVDFWWMWRDGGWYGWSNGEDWFVEYYDGSAWRIVLDRDYPSGYSKSTWYHEIVYINKTNYTFPTNMKIRFRCDASDDYDDVYIDQIYINATAGNIKISNFSGFIDEFRIYNRALSPEQIYQNYLCMKNGFSNINVIVSEETNLNETWICILTPNDSAQDDEAIISNSLKIKRYIGGKT